MELAGTFPRIVLQQIDAAPDEYGRANCEEEVKATEVAEPALFLSLGECCPRANQVVTCHFEANKESHDQVGQEKCPPPAGVVQVLLVNSERHFGLLDVFVSNNLALYLLVVVALVAQLDRVDICLLGASRLFTNVWVKIDFLSTELAFRVRSFAELNLLDLFVAINLHHLERFFCSL